MKGIKVKQGSGRIIFCLLLAILSIFLYPSCSNTNNEDNNENSKERFIAGEFSPAPSEGINQVLVLLVNFSDTQPTFTPDDFYHFFFSEQGNTFRNYYQEVSYGKLNLEGKVVGWLQASHTHDFYGGGFGQEALNYPGNISGLVEEAIDLAEKQGVDFSRYDNNGDGWVDSLIVIHQGLGAEKTRDKTDIWTTVSTLSIGGAQPRFYDGVKIEYFAILPELSSSDPSKILKLGPAVHEYGHLLGMIDLYSWEVKKRSIGTYGLMSYGDFGGDGNSPDQPVEPCVFHKLFLGWVEPLPAVGDTIITLPSLKQMPVAIKVPFGSDPSEYFLISYRKKQGFDEKLPSEGVFIWHIDEKSARQNIWTAQVNNNCTTSSKYLHPQVMLEQADGLFELEQGLDWGDTYDAWQVGEVFSTTSLPFSFGYNCFPSGVKIEVLDETTTSAELSIQHNQYQTNFSSPQLWLREYKFEPTLESDSDPYPEAGERLGFRIKLFNTGTDLLQPRIIFSTTSDFLEIENGSTINLPDLATGESIWSEPVYFRIKDFSALEIPAKMVLSFEGNSGSFSRLKSLKISLGKPEILLVDDDEGRKAQDLVIDWLIQNGYSFQVWETASQGIPSLDFLLNHQAVVWLCGIAQPPLNDEEISLLEKYLEAGGKLFLSSAYLLVNPTESARRFAQNYLGIKDWQDNHYSVHYVFGTDHPASSGISNRKMRKINYYPLHPRNVALTPVSSAQMIFKNLWNNPVMIQYSPDSHYGVIYSSFGIEHFDRSIMFPGSNPTNSGLFFRLLNSFMYHPSQPFVYSITPSTSRPRNPGLWLTISGYNLNENTEVVFPEGEIEIWEKSFNSVNNQIILRVKVNVFYYAHPGYHPISLRNPGTEWITFNHLFQIKGTPLPNTPSPPQAVIEASPTEGKRRDSFILDASQSSDPNYDPLSFIWTQLEGPAVSLQPSSTAEVVSFQARDDYLGDYLFKLEVSDGELSSSDTVRISVKNQPPFAQVAERIIYGMVDQNMILDGSPSYDPDGDAITYQWSQLSGATVSLSPGSTNCSPSFIPNLPGNYLFQLVVSDGFTVSEPVQVEAIITSDNNPPVAEAGDTIMVDLALGHTTLDGTASYDPDNDPLLYSWTIIQKPDSANATLDSNTSPTPIFSYDQPGKYLLDLRVFDGEVWSPEDILTVWVIITDQDGDLMKDEWEISHGLDPTNSSDGETVINPITDPDGDGLVNLYEYFNGTDPQVAEPWLITCQNQDCWKAGFFGDADGDLLYSSTDAQILDQSLQTGDTSGYSQIYPSNGDPQDYDGDGLITASDLSLLNQLLSGDTSGFTGRPEKIILLEPSSGEITVSVGDTVRICGQVLDQDFTPRSGSAVNFDIVEGKAEILGGDGEAPAGRFIKPVEELNVPDAGDFSLFMRDDGLEVFFSSNRLEDGDSIQDNDLYRATRSSLDEPFSSPEPVAELNSSTCNEASPSLTSDGSIIFFYRVCESSPKTTPSGIYYAIRPSLDQPFSPPEPVSELNSDNGKEYGLWISPNGLTIYFATNNSELAGYQGGQDLWVAVRDSTTAEFGPPQNLSELNSSAREIFPALSPDQLEIIFMSDRDSGSWQLYYARRDELGQTFSIPTALDSVNQMGSGNKWSPFLSQDGKSLYLAYPEEPGSPYEYTDIFRVIRFSEQVPFFVDIHPARFDFSGKINTDSELNSAGKACIYLKSLEAGDIKVMLNVFPDEDRYLSGFALEQLVIIHTNP